MPRKSWIAETAATIATPVKAAVKALASTPRTRDAFLSDRPRRKDLTARGVRRWLAPRPDWLRRWRA